MGNTDDVEAKAGLTASGNWNGMKKETEPSILCAEVERMCSPVCEKKTGA